MATLRRGGAALSAQDQADIRRDIGLGTAATSAASDFATAAQGTDAREWTAATVDQAEAEAGTATTRRAWTAQRVRQAIVAWWNGYSSAAGRTLVTAADAAAQRTAIGAAAFTTAQTTAGGTAVAALTSGGVLLDAAGEVLPTVIANNITQPLIMRESTAGVHEVIRHNPQSPAAGGYQFTFGYNGGAAFTNGPTSEPNYVDDVWWFGFNSAGADIPIDATKAAFSAQFESKFSQGGPSSPFGSEFHLSFKPVTGAARRLFTSFLPHDMSTASNRVQFAASLQANTFSIRDAFEAIRLQASFDDGSGGAVGLGNWDFGPTEILRINRKAGNAFMAQLNFAGNAFLSTPFYDADDRLRFPAAIGCIGAAPTAGTYPNKFFVLQATTGAANGTLLDITGPSVTGNYYAFDMQASASVNLFGRLYNSNNTVNAHAVLHLLTREAGGDPVVRFESNGQRTWALGLDRDQGFRFALSKFGGTLGTSNDVMQIEATNVWFVANCTAAPASNATGGGNLYVEAGALKWRGSSGTVTTLGPA